MVFGAVKRHQGFVEVTSHENQGTTFQVYIPLLQNKTTLPKTKNSNKLTTQGDGELILLVDDEAMVLEMGTDVLQSLGYRVLQASDGLEAVEIFMANQHDIALVITDIVMPRLGGIEAAERIRNIQANSKIIFSSGFDPNSTLTQNILAKNEIILSKPYHINALSEAMLGTHNLSSSVAR